MEVEEEAEVAAGDSPSRVRPARVASAAAAVAAAAVAAVALRWAKGEEAVAAVRKPEQVDGAGRVPEPVELGPASVEPGLASVELLDQPGLAERALKGKPR